MPTMALREALGIGECEAGLASIDEVLGSSLAVRPPDAKEVDGLKLRREGGEEVGKDTNGEKMKEMTEVSFEEIYRNIEECDRNVERSRRLREKLQEGLKERQEEALFKIINRSIAEWERNVELSGRLREQLQARLKERQEEVTFDEIDFDAGETELEKERRGALPKQAGSKYHCLLQRHMFVRPAPSERVLNGGEDSWIVCQKCGIKVWEGDCLVCEVPECGVMACSACVWKWENERRAKATGRWRAGSAGDRSNLTLRYTNEIRLK